VALTLLSHSHVRYASGQYAVLQQLNGATWTVYDPEQSLYARRPSTPSLPFYKHHIYLVFRVVQFFSPFILGVLTPVT